MYTYDCVAKFCMSAIHKITDDTTIVGQMSNNDESKSRKEIEGLVMWYNENNLPLNVTKTKELIIIFRKKVEHAPIYVNGTEVERVKSIKFLGDYNKLQKVVCPVQIITEANLPSMDSIYIARCSGRTSNAPVMTYYNLF
eukprot:g47604.t1